MHHNQACPTLLVDVECSLNKQKRTDRRTVRKTLLAIYGRARAVVKADGGHISMD